MIKYKLTDQAMQTHGGFQWVLGKKEVIAIPGDELCSNQVFHYYASPEQAGLFNCVHAEIKNPRLFKAEIDREVTFDGLKGGCHEMTLVEELPLPEITTDQRVEFSIKVALAVYCEHAFTTWAGAWLSGEDRSKAAARAASAVPWAASAAPWSAEAAWWAVEAALAASAAEAARAAAWSAGAAGAARAAGENTLDFQSIIDEVLHK